MCTAAFGPQGPGARHPKRPLLPLRLRPRLDPLRLAPLRPRTAAVAACKVGGSACAFCGASSVLKYVWKEQLGLALAEQQDMVVAVACRRVNGIARGC